MEHSKPDSYSPDLLLRDGFCLFVLFQACGTLLTNAGMDSHRQLGPQNYTVLLAPPKKRREEKYIKGGDRGVGSEGTKLSLGKKVREGITSYDFVSHHLTLF